MFVNRKAIKLKTFMFKFAKLPSLNSHCSPNACNFPHCQSSQYVQHNNYSKWYDENYNGVYVVIHLHVVLLNAIT